MTRAALLVARMIDREQYLRDELATLVQNGIDHVGRGVLKSRNIGMALEADDVIQDKARIAYRWRVLGHGINVL